MNKKYKKEFEKIKDSILNTPDKIWAKEPSLSVIDREDPAGKARVGGFFYPGRKTKYYMGGYGYTVGLYTTFVLSETIKLN